MRSHFRDAVQPEEYGAVSPTRPCRCKGESASLRNFPFSLLALKVERRPARPILNPAVRDRDRPRRRPAILTQRHTRRGFYPGAAIGSKLLTGSLRPRRHSDAGAVIPVAACSCTALQSPLIRTLNLDLLRNANQISAPCRVGTRNARV